MDKKSYIFSELGIILLGFSIYESIFSSANKKGNFISGFPKGFLIFSHSEFTLIIAFFVVIYVFSIVALIFNMYKYQYRAVIGKRRVSTIEFMCLIFIFLAPYWLLGFRVAFCACLGVALIELGMFIDTESRRKNVQPLDSE
jgi:hypothetical protein